MASHYNQRNNLVHHSEFSVLNSRMRFVLKQNIIEHHELHSNAIKYDPKNKLSNMTHVNPTDKEDKITNYSILKPFKAVCLCITNEYITTDGHAIRLINQGNKLVSRSAGPGGP